VWWTAEKQVVSLLETNKKLAYILPLMKSLFVLFIIISYLYYIQVNPVTGEKQVHRQLDIEHVKRQNKNAPTIIGTSPKI
jgi:hypothetical protein